MSDNPYYEHFHEPSMTWEVRRRVGEDSEYVIAISNTVSAVSRYYAETIAMHLNLAYSFGKEAEGED